MFLDDDRQRYTACKEWLRRRLGTPDQLARYRAFVEQFDAQQAAAIVSQSPQTSLNLVAQTPFEDPPAAVLPEPSPVVVDGTDQETPQVKIWPLVGLAAINKKHGGAWRVWVYAHALDLAGSGRVSRADLFTHLRALGVDERRRRRWVRDAITLGLLRNHDDTHYYLAGLSKGAIILGCHNIGAPVEVSAGDLVRSGWRALVWSGYLATLNGRPMSQEKKHELTGVDPRVQRYYQSTVPGGVRRNYAKTEHTSDHEAGLADLGRAGVFVGYDGKLIYRLPDQRFVSPEVAKTTHKGRSNKAQKQINLSCTVEREQGLILRLFHDKSKGVETSLRKIIRADIPLWKLPGEVYELLHAGVVSNLWRPVAIEAIRP